MHFIDQLIPDDCDSIISLSSSVGWDYTQREVQVFLTAGRLFGHRREGGRIVSCAGVFPYGKLASIGVVIVHPKFQGQGFGRALMQRCLTEVSDIPTILVSTVQGQRLYTSLGFQTVSYIHKLLSKQPLRWSESVERWRFKVLGKEDYLGVIRLDEEVFGANRGKFLTPRFPLLHEGIVLRDSEEILRGYAMSVTRNNLLIVGPVVAPDHDSALAMVHYLTREWSGPIRVDVPSAQDRFLDRLTRLGMYEEERPPVMMRNGDTLPGDRSRLYAIAAQAFG